MKAEVKLSGDKESNRGNNNKREVRILWEKDVTQRTFVICAQRFGMSGPNPQKTPSQWLSRTSGRKMLIRGVLTFFILTLHYIIPSHNPVCVGIGGVLHREPDSPLLSTFYSLQTPSIFTQFRELSCYTFLAK